MEKRQIFQTLTVTALCAVIGICAGRIASAVYNYYAIARLENANRVSGITEAKIGNKNYSVLPLMTEQIPEEELPGLRRELQDYKIDFIETAGKILVADSQLPLALDVAHAAGFSRDADHFSFREITADPEKEPERHAVQRRLAEQNMLASVITLLTADITGARVKIDPRTRAATVKLSRQSSGEIPPKLREEIILHVRAVAGDISVTVE